MRGLGLIVLALAALASTPAAAARIARTVTVSASDYPDDVPPSASEFHVGIQFELARDGSVARCRIVRASGQPSLDAASCRIFQERARVRPGPRSMRGTLHFLWLSERSLDNGNARGAPIPLGFIDMISSADYPSEAIRNGESGTVEYDVEVSATGVPLGCAVTSSSGSRALDRRTCELVMTRASFIPASDGAGGRRPGTFRGRFTWRR